MRYRPISNGTDFAILPLLKIIWKYSVQLQISVERSILDEEGVSHVAPFTTMSETLQSLCRDDLGFMKYQDTLACIAVGEDGSAGDMVFWTTS